MQARLLLHWKIPCKGFAFNWDNDGPKHYDGASNISGYIMLRTVITVAATTDCLSEYATDPTHSNYHASHSVHVQAPSHIKCI